MKYIPEQMAMVCPITNTKKNFPLYVNLDERIKTTADFLADKNVWNLIFQSKKRSKFFIGKLAEPAFAGRHG
jgi:hypothetical protein